MHELLVEARELYWKFVEQLDVGIVGLQDVKRKIAMLPLGSVLTTYSDDKEQRVNAGTAWLSGVPGVGKTYFGLILAKATDTKFGRIQGRADLTPADIVGCEVWNPKIGDFEKRPGVIVNVGVVLLDEINRIPPKAQSAFLEPLNDKTVTIADTTYHLPAYYFALATSNPVEGTEGTFPLSEANADRFTFFIKVGYVTPEDEQKLVQFDIKGVDIKAIISPERVVTLRSAVSDHVRLHPLLDEYVTKLVLNCRPRETRKSKENQNPSLSVSPLVEEFVELGASPRATMCLGRMAKVRALVIDGRDYVCPEDVQDLAENVLLHRIGLKPSAKSMGITVEQVVQDVIDRVPIP